MYAPHSNGQQLKYVHHPEFDCLITTTSHMYCNDGVLTLPL